MDRSAREIFVSYSRTDSLFVEHLTGLMEEAGYKIWRDTKIIPGQQWAQEITNALQRCAILVVVVSPDSMRSRYVEIEIEGFLTQQKPIIPLLVRPTEEMHPEIRARHWIDFRDGFDFSDGFDEERFLQLQNAFDAYLASDVPRSQPHETPRIDGQQRPPISPPKTPPPSGQPPHLPPTQPPSHTPSTPAPDARKLEIVARALSDKPTADDLLGFKVYAQAIAGFILDPKTDRPLTIAINAPWGSGKSSLMVMIRKELNPPPHTVESARLNNSWLRSVMKRIDALRRRVITALWGAPVPNVQTVWFNAWKYDKEEALWAALALEVIRQVADHYPWWKRLHFKWLLHGFDARRLLMDALRSLLMLFIVGGVGIAMLIAISVWQGVALSDAINMLILPSILGGGAVALYNFGNSIIRSSKDLLNLHLDRYLKQQPDYPTKIGFLGEFESDFNRLVDIVTADGKTPLVIFIDDLDRCSVPKVAELMEAINILLNTKHCVFIIGMDTRIIAASIEVRYEKLRPYLIEQQSHDPRLGMQFLEKIVQIIFPIPQSNRATMVRFIEGNLRREEETPENIDAIQEKADQVAERIAQSPTITSVQQIVAQVNHAVRLEAVESQTQIKEIAVTELILKNFDSLDEVRQVIVEMLDILEYNPRRVKRFINVFRLQAFIAGQRGKLTSPRQLAALGACLQIAFRWPTFASMIITNPNLDNDLHFIENTIPILPTVDDDQRRIELEQQLAIATGRDQNMVTQFLDDPHKGELLDLLGTTTTLGDDEVGHIFTMVLQIVASTPVVSMAKS